MKMEGIKFTTSRGLLLAKKFSPEILTGVGIVSILAGTVSACKATLKAEEVLEDARVGILLVKDVREEMENEGKVMKANGDSMLYSDNDYRKDMAIVYVSTAVDFLKLYGPAVSLLGLGIGSILTGHNIMKKRNLALIGAYKLAEQTFEDYRKRVIEEFGEDKDRLFKTGKEVEKVTIEDENGKKKKVDQETLGNPSQYARFYDDGCKEWSKMPDYNLTFLKCQQNYANDLLQSRGHIFLNEVYDLLGIPRTSEGAVVGWVKGHGDDFVDFGIFDPESEKKRDFVNGYERAILLDFNVDGVIYDLI